MRSKQDILVILLILLVIFCVRLYGWYNQDGKRIQAGGEHELEILVWEKALARGWYTVLPYQAWQARCPEKVTLCGKWLELEAGDRVRVVGEWQKPAANGGQSYLAVEKVIQIEKKGSLTPLSGWWWLRQIYILRERILDVYKFNLSEPYSGLIAGIVLGEKSQLPPDFYEALIRTGTVHIIAASGYNISVVAGALIAVLVLVLPRRKALVWAMAGIFTYVVMAGSSPPVIRAGIMGAMMVLAQRAGRQYAASFAFILSVVLMLIVWPWMIWSVSFLLSASATAGIIWGTAKVSQLITKIQIPITKQYLKSKILNNNIMKTKENRLMVGELGTTLSATLATLPIILIYFERLSMISPLINILVLWLVPPVMALGGGLAIVGLISPLLAPVLAYLTYPLLWLFVTIIEWGATIPMASVEMPGVNWLLACGWWILLGAWWGKKKGGMVK